MDRRLHSLPPLRQMVDVPQSRGTDPSHHQNNASWTAINHRPEGPGSVSPPTPTPTHNPLPIPNGHHSAPSHPHDHSNPRLPRQDQTTPTSVSAASCPPNCPPEPAYVALSFDRAPARFPPPEHHVVGKPITARQDSAVYLSVAAPVPPACTASIAPGTSSSARPETSPDRYHRTVLAASAAHPLTPPSDPASTHHTYAPPQQPVCDGPRDVPSPSAHQDKAGLLPPRRRERSRSDLTNSTATLPHAMPFPEGRNSMPPPPIPATMALSEPLAADTPSLPLSNGTCQQPSDHSPDASNAAEAESSIEKCAICNDTWTYPPPDASHLPLEPSRTYKEAQRQMDALSTFTSNYLVRKEASYERWKQRHSCGHHCQYPDPRSSNKRKHDDYAGDSPPSKSQKCSSESPPRPSRLTPPPDPATSEASPGPVYFEASHGPPIPLQPDVARVFGRYIPPTDDSNNMFYDAQ